MGPKITSAQAWHRVAGDVLGAEETVHVQCALLKRGAMEAFTTTRGREPESK